MNAKRLSTEEWTKILDNIKEYVEDESNIFEDTWVNVSWLDGTNEYVLHFDGELFEDGFKTEEEAYNRLYSLEQQIL